MPVFDAHRPRNNETVVRGLGTDELICALARENSRLSELNDALRRENDQLRVDLMAQCIDFGEEASIEARLSDGRTVIIIRANDSASLDYGVIIGGPDQ